jgi:hypothetical protein
MDGNQEIMKLLSEILDAQEATVKKLYGCYALTIVLIVLLLPILWSAWHLVLVRWF